jgi:hypothetical protein
VEYGYSLSQTSGDTTTHQHSSHREEGHILEGTQFTNSESSDDNAQPALYSRVPVRSVGRIELIRISNPLDIGVFLNVIELWVSHRPRLLRKWTDQFQVVISWNTLDILDSTLLESLDKVSRKRDSVFHIYSSISV